MSQPVAPSPEPVSRSIPVWRKILYSMLAVGFVLLMIEGATSVVYAVISAGEIGATHEQYHCDYDPDLGWSHKPNFVAKDLYGEGRTLTTNAQALRGTRDYTKEVPTGKMRVICLGDSFTLGYGVNDADTFTAKMEKFEPRIETVNMGQGGYGLDQAMLWYKRDGVKLDADVVLFSYVYVDFFRMPEDKFNNFFPKPLIEAKNDKIVEIKNVPVPKKWGSINTFRKITTFGQKLAVGRFMNDVLPRTQKAWYETIPQQREIARAVFAEMQRICRERNQTLVIAYLPIHQMIAREPTRELQCGGEFAAQHQIPFLNLVPAFAQLNPRDLRNAFREDWHFTIQGNELAARALLHGLRQAVPKFPR